MHIHEYQAKELFIKHGLPVPAFEVIDHISQVPQALAKLNAESVVVKVQVHAGGRGKAGGVKIAKGLKEVEDTVEELLGKKIVNEQTGPEGIIARQVMITLAVDIVHEYYLSILVDRIAGCPVLIASREGGMDIEEVAKDNPSKILKIPLPDRVIRGYQLVKLLKFMQWDKPLAARAKDLIIRLVNIFFLSDATLIEINPLILNHENELIILDAKVDIDDDALFRQESIRHFYDPTQLSQAEAEAHAAGLAYVGLGGEVGCMVNGAGLAMATMDIIHHFGAAPANFLDVGGSATEDKVATGFKIILMDQNVKAILVNIFGGIMNCATIAHGIVQAMREVSIRVPLVVRLEGTNVEEGKKVISDSKLSIIAADTLSDAAKKAVDAAKRA